MTKSNVCMSSSRLSREQSILKLLELVSRHQRSLGCPLTLSISSFMDIPVLASMARRVAYGVAGTGKSHMLLGLLGFMHFLDSVDQQQLRCTSRRMQRGGASSWYRGEYHASSWYRDEYQSRTAVHLHRMSWYQ
jgi:hypothetical protein